LQSLMTTTSSTPSIHLQKPLANRLDTQGPLRTLSRPWEPTRAPRHHFRTVGTNARTAPKAGFRQHRPPRTSEGSPPSTRTTHRHWKPNHHAREAPARFRGRGSQREPPGIAFEPWEPTREPRRRPVFTSIGPYGRLRAPHRPYEPPIGYGSPATTLERPPHVSKAVGTSASQPVAPPDRGNQREIPSAGAETCATLKSDPVPLSERCATHRNRPHLLPPFFSRFSAIYFDFFDPQIARYRSEAAADDPEGRRGRRQRRGGVYRP
jgi:hypothetical protein